MVILPYFQSFDFSQFFGAGGGRRGGFTFRTNGFQGAESINMEEMLSSLFGGAGQQRQQMQKGADLLTNVSITFMESVKGTTRLLTLGDTGKKLKVKIPRGIDNGGRVRLRGQGQPGLYGARNGDLIITVRVMPDQDFKREGNDIFTSATISFKEAILGCKVSIKTLTKTISLKVPPGVQPGTKMRLKGQGLAVGGKQGDQYVEIKVSIPESITDQQRKLLDEWGE